MHITPNTERALIELAQRGYWPEVKGDRLLILTTRAEVAPLTDTLKAEIKAVKGEMLEVVPRLDSENVALTGPVVRVMFARLPTNKQQRPTMTQAEFSEQYDRLTTSERVVFLWWYMDGPVNDRNTRLKGEAA